MKEDMTFEEAMERLESIVSRFDTDEAGLEASLELYEEGVKLAAYCREKLERAEQRVTKLDEALNDR